jgi:hypothetical protein
MPALAAPADSDLDPEDLDHPAVSRIHNLIFLLLNNIVCLKAPAGPAAGPALPLDLDPQEMFHGNWVLPADLPVSVIFILSFSYEY